MGAILLLLVGVFCLGYGLWTAWQSRHVSHDPWMGG